MVAGKSQFNENDTSTVARENRSQLIDFTRSDGKTSHRPTADQQDPTVRGGEVNYHRKVYLNEPGAAGWRQKVGTALAKDLGLDTKKTWYLSDWPKDYELFVHLKGPVGAPRHDLYLFGGPSKFRSANEFYPHARWLLTDETLNPANCACKYCGNTKMQRQINFREGLGPPVSSAPVTPRHSNKGTPTASGSKGASRRSTRPKQERGPSAPPTLKFHPVNTYLENDLRSKRSFRLGEIVWIHLDPPIVCESRSEGKIDWWPAIVQEPKPKRDVILPGQPFAVEQQNMYRVLMLSVRAQYLIPEHRILPYLAYTPPEPLLRYLGALAGSATTIPDFVHAKAEHSAFLPLPNPYPTSSDIFLPPAAPVPRDFQSALFPFLVAYKMSQHMTTFWTATDTWDFVSEATADQPSVKQTRYQGLWWGSERIWLGDLVRIKPPRSLLSGDLLPPSPGAEERCMFLKMEAIYLDPVETPDGEKSWNMNVSGTLYELADKNFGVQQPSAPVASSSTSLPPRPPPATSASTSRLQATSSAPQIAPQDTTDHTLPPPPPGYKFRAITPSAEFDAHFDFLQLAGRYYPSLMGSPLLASATAVTTFTPDPQSSKLVPEYPASSKTLVGMAPGNHNAISPENWKESRTPMLGAAKEEAAKDFARVKPQLQLPDVFMTDVASKQALVRQSSLHRELFGEGIFATL